MSNKTSLRTLAVGFLAVVAVLIGIGVLRQSIQKTRGGGTPRYIFLFIGDGMGNSHVCAAESYLSWKAGKLGGEQLLFTTFPELALASTYSADHQVTCSSASATAFSSGHKTNNLFIGATPDSLPTRPFTMDLQERGYRIGIMSSVPINHATPAAFYAHQTDRWGYYPITEQLPSSGYDFFAGPGFIDWAGRDGNQTPTDSLLEAGGYTLCYGEDEFRSHIDESKLILCQENRRGRSASSYTINYDTSWMPLSKMLSLGLEHFGDRQPFFIMCEGGEIDWCAHENSVYPMVQAILRFDDAVRTAYEFYLKHPDETLIVVTADHETGGLAIGYNFDWKFSVQDWARVEAEWLAEGCDDTLRLQDRLRFQNDCGFGWSTNEHTGAPVPVYAIGKGAERFNGRIDNTQIPSLILGQDF
ncbi:MAG: alkaline phosphatase [Bacteroidales bacterium]|nr:alkaline phosphatase [Bacteroidales bacterium]